MWISSHWSWPIVWRLIWELRRRKKEETREKSAARGGKKCGNGLERERERESERASERAVLIIINGARVARKSARALWPRLIVILPACGARLLSLTRLLACCQMAPGARGPNHMEYNFCRPISGRHSSSCLPPPPPPPRGGYRAPSVCAAGRKIARAHSILSACDAHEPAGRQTAQVLARPSGNLRPVGCKTLECSPLKCASISLDTRAPEYWAGQSGAGHNE